MNIFKFIGNTLDGADTIVSNVIGMGIDITGYGKEVTHSFVEEQRAENAKSLEILQKQLDSMD